MVETPRRAADVMSWSVPVGVILAGGLGTRMQPLTRTTPKPMLPVGGEPIVLHQLRQLASAGLQDVVLAISHRAEDFEQVSVLGSELGVRVRLSVEDTPMGTGGGLAMAARSLPVGPDDQPVVVLNGDLLTGHDLSAQIAALRDADGRVDGVVHVRQVLDARPFGSVTTDDEGVITAFVEKSPHPPSREVNAGTYVLRRGLLEDLERQLADTPISMEREVFPEVVARRGLLAYREDAYFRDVGSPAALVAASRDVVTRGVPEADSPTGRSGIVHPGATVEDSARVVGGASVLPGARICAGALVDGSIILEGAVVGVGAEVRASVLGERAVVGAGARLRQCALGAGVEIAAGAALVDELLEPQS